MATQCVKEGPVQNGDLDLVAAGEFASWLLTFLPLQEQFSTCKKSDSAFVYAVTKKYEPQDFNECRMKNFSCALLTGQI